jgi:DNA-binding transcriptional regulator LsrR (DeoR family)
MENKSETQLMVQAARYYYERGLTQQQIARRLSLTRQKVSRLLIRARSEGIVNITILDPGQTDQGLSGELQQFFDLHKVILIPGDGVDSRVLRTRLGTAAAEHIAQILQDESTVGIGWGRTLYEVVNALPKGRQTRINVVPLIGGIGDMPPFFQVNSLALRFAEAFGGQYRLIHIPAFTLDRTVWETLNNTQEVQGVTGLWKKLDLAIVGIGQVELQHLTSMFFADHFSPGMLEQLEAFGAVGDICARFFDRLGNPVNPGTGVIGIDINDLRTTKEVIGVAGGLEKVKAVLGALRGGYIKTLVTDTITASAVLAEARPTK